MLNYNDELADKRKNRRNGVGEVEKYKPRFPSKTKSTPKQAHRYNETPERIYSLDELDFMLSPESAGACSSP